MNTHDRLQNRLQARHIVPGQYMSWDKMSRDKMSPDLYFDVCLLLFLYFVFSEVITWVLAWSPWSSHCHPFHQAPPFVPPNNKIFRLRWKIFQQDGISQTSEKFFYKDYYNVLVYHRLASPPLQWARQRVFWSLCSSRSPTTRNCSHWPGWSVGLIGIGLARFAVVLFGFQIVRPLFEIF